MKQERAELASLIVIVQASLSLVAALVALPFGIVEPGFRALGLLTIAVAALMFWFGRNLRQGRRWALRWLIGIETAGLLPTILLGLLPIGAVRGPVPLLVNLVLPISVLVLLLVPSKPAETEATPARHETQQEDHDGGPDDGRKQRNPRQ